MSFSASKSIELCEHYLTICNHKENITLSGTKCLLLWILGLASKNMYIYNPTNPRRPKHKKRALRSPWRCGRGQVQVLITILTQRQERARMHNVSHNFFFHNFFFFIRTGRGWSWAQHIKLPLMQPNVLIQGPACDTSQCLSTNCSAANPTRS